jgi:PPOX class F420-dependent enzyme/OxyR family protein
VDGSGAPQNDPVGFFIDEASSQVFIRGFNLAQSRKFRNLTANPNVAFVVDDLASVDPWTPRGVEMRGWGEALTDADPRCRDSAASSSASPGLDRQLGPGAGNVVPMTIRRADG